MGFYKIINIIFYQLRQTVHRVIDTAKRGNTIYHK
jgi:hypothetical protein